MDLTKRAFLFVVRKKRKNLSLFLLFILITTFITVSFSIFAAAQAAAAGLRETTGASFTLRGRLSDVPFSTDVISYNSQFLPISRQAIDAVADNQDIKASNAQQTGTALSDGFNLTSGNPYATILANTDTAWNRSFTNGTLTLAEGRHIAREDHMTALISRELADENGFRTGDCLSLSSLEESAGSPVTMEIIGIYESDPEMEFDADTIFTDHDTFWTLAGLGNAEYYGKADFFVYDPDSLEAIIEQARQNSSIPWDHYTLSADLSDYAAISYQLLSLGRLTMLLIVCSVTVSAVVLLFILTMRVRNRIQEIGILLAAGIPKDKIVSQFILEALALLLAAILISCPVGYFAATQLGAYLRGLVRTISVSLPVRRLLLQYLVEIAVVFIGVVLAAGPLIRLKPKDILTKMS